MPMLLYGNGMISGATSMPTNVQFGGTVGVTGALNTSSTFTTSGALTASSGIAFPATQAFSADANTLDDYEEGTFTPTITTTSGTVTSYTAAGAYTKIGRVVEVTIKVVITNVGSAAGSYMNVFGLPFTCSADHHFMGVCRENAVAGNLIQAAMGPSSTSFALLLYNNNGTVLNGGDYKISLVYRV